MIALPGMAALWAALPEARMVGGAVRDWLAGVAVADVDFAVPLAPETVMARARAAGLNVIPTGIAHGTVTVVTPERSFEVTSLRRDVETDGRHAVVAFVDDWQLDASRRDFTINAMSAAQDGTVYDYFEGREDLAAGRVRFVGAATARIAEDYLRIFRFFRFFARYGRGEPDAAAVAAIAALREGVKTLSAERVWSELKRILAAPDPREVMRLMQRTQVLDLVLPEVDLARFEQLLRRGAPEAPLLRVAALLTGGEGAAETFAARWRLSKAEEAELAALSAPNELGPDAADDDVRRALEAEPAETLAGRTWLAPGEGWERLRARLAAMKRPVFALQGRDLQALGMMPGPAMGALLQRVHEWWRQGGCVADAATCRAYAQALLEAKKV
ncbi:MAG TPA: CCA tRNA nucleotidyltransferase [Acidocella sp.]|jgi:poly(A) polymerase|uniref:CCA tRNA nucleotidyltransferase n=1 Tax=Acidocella sp. TaxID=50710 RepID=UPI002C01D536|nr:CCA tRNA nucleotidyltransferase [Acidocella sp.]HVE21648.1 CCA tRNA nucleotidyltransferase [Acidocella sp.]